jgi:hypothetical protein
MYTRRGPLRQCECRVRKVDSDASSGWPVALHASMHSTLHVGIALLRLMQPVPLEEGNRHNVPAHCRQQPITQAGVAEWLQCIPGEVRRPVELERRSTIARSMLKSGDLMRREQMELRTETASPQTPASPPSLHFQTIDILAAPTIPGSWHHSHFFQSEILLQMSQSQCNFGCLANRATE